MSKAGLIIASTCCLLLATGLYLAGSPAAAFVALGVSIVFDVGYVRRLLAEQRRTKEAR